MAELATNVSLSSHECSVALAQQLSDAPCKLHESFGCDDNTPSMWIFRGCRGRFDCAGHRVHCGQRGSSTRAHRQYCQCVPSAKDNSTQPDTSAGNTAIASTVAASTSHGTPPFPQYDVATSLHLARDACIRATPERPSHSPLCETRTQHDYEVVIYGKSSCVQASEPGRRASLGCLPAFLELSPYDFGLKYIFSVVAHVRYSEDEREHIRFQAGSFSMSSIFGGENWGHQLADDFFPIYKHLRRAASGTEHTVLLANGCKDYPWQGCRPKWHTSNEQFTADCSRHVGVLSRAVGVKVAAAPTTTESPFCVRQLLLGGSMKGGIKFSEDWHDVEAYRDHIIRGLGRDPLARPRTPSVAIYAKVGGRVRRQFENTDELCAAIQRLLGWPVRLWMPDATTPLEEQVDVMLNTSILVTPGGGGAFSALFLAKGSRLVVWPYAWASEELHFRTHMQWLDSVDFWAPRGVNGGMQQTGTSMRITYPIKDILRIINESRTARTRVTP